MVILQQSEHTAIAVTAVQQCNILQIPVQQYCFGHGVLFTRLWGAFSILDMTYSEVLAHTQQYFGYVAYSQGWTLRSWFK